jgi:hypothetical protein
MQHAAHRCEYWQLPKRYPSTPFQIDHIVAEEHPTTAGNLAWACMTCNHHKGPNLGGIDFKTGKRVWLFHPRRHKWSRHFRWDGPVLIGRTAMSRATVDVLAVNLAHRVAQRAALIAEGVFPPR